MVLSKPPGRCARRILLLTAVWLFLIDSSAALALTGREIAERMDRTDSSETSESVITMTVRRQGQELKRVMGMKKKKYPDMERQILRFAEPGEVRDTSYLTWSYKHPARDDDMWVFLPAESLVRRISGGGKKGSFMRSDYANEDIVKRDPDDDTHTLQREEPLSGVDCYVVSMAPVYPDKTQYSQRLVWVRKDIWLPAKVEFFDKGGRCVKELVFGGYKEIQGIWTSTVQRMRPVGGTSETILESASVRYNGEIPDTAFRSTDLKR